MDSPRLALGVEVMPGNASAPAHGMPGIWAWLDALPVSERPALLRGDIAYGNESVLREAEAQIALTLNRPLRLRDSPAAQDAQA